MHIYSYIFSLLCWFHISSCILYTRVSFINDVCCPKSVTAKYSTSSQKWANSQRAAVFSPISTDRSSGFLTQNVATIIYGIMDPGHKAILSNIRNNFWVDYLKSNRSHSPITNQLTRFDLLEDLLDGFTVRAPLEIYKGDVSLDINRYQLAHAFSGNLGHICKIQVNITYKQTDALNMQEKRKKEEDHSVSGLKCCETLHYRKIL